MDGRSGLGIEPSGEPPYRFKYSKHGEGLRRSLVLLRIIPGAAWAIPSGGRVTMRPLRSSREDVNWL
jgi:hypothetical protein